MKTLKKHIIAMFVASCAASACYSAEKMPPIPPRIEELSYPANPEDSWTADQRASYDELLKAHKSLESLQKQIYAAERISAGKIQSQQSFREWVINSGGIAPPRRATDSPAEQQASVARYAKQDELKKSYEASFMVFRMKTGWTDPLADQIRTWNTYFASHKRQWRDQGNRRLDAVLAAFDGKTVSLLTNVGKKMSLPAKAFSAEDQAYMRTANQ